MKTVVLRLCADEEAVPSIVEKLKDLLYLDADFCSLMECWEILESEIEVRDSTQEESENRTAWIESGCGPWPAD